MQRALVHEPPVGLEDRDGAHEQRLDLEHAPLVLPLLHLRRDQAHLLLQPLARGGQQRRVGVLARGGAQQQVRRQRVALAGLSL